jgi:lysophospholipase L1-like esterase
MARGPAGVAADEAGHWVHTWVAMPQLTEDTNLPPAPFMRPGSAFADATLRQTVRISVGARFFRLRISNAFGGAALPITAASIALPAGGNPGVSAIEPGSARPVTFGGNASVIVPVGSQAVSDPVDFPLPALTNVTVNLYLAQGQASSDITSHPGSRTTTHIVGGNHLDDPDLSGALSVEHWYFISGIEAWSAPETAAAVMLGDSLTDGRGSTTDGNDRWSDQLLGRLHAEGETAGVAILNQGAGGNRVLNDGLGPNAIGRIDRDVLAQSGVKWLLVFEGVNDIGTAPATDAAQKQLADELIAAYQQIITRAHAAGIRVYGATITPFGGSDYDDPQGLREAARQAVNTWIRTSRRFDAVLDFDEAVRDPANPRQLLPAYDVGDHLHMNPTGYKTLAEAIPTGLFTNRSLPPGFGFR